MNVKDYKSGCSLLRGIRRALGSDSHSKLRGWGAHLPGWDLLDRVSRSQDWDTDRSLLDSAGGFPLLPQYISRTEPGHS